MSEWSGVTLLEPWSIWVGSVLGLAYRRSPVVAGTRNCGQQGADRTLPTAAAVGRVGSGSFPDYHWFLPCSCFGLSIIAMFGHIILTCT